MEMLTMKSKTTVKYASKDEWKELEKDSPENIIQMVQQSDGSFELKSPHDRLPLFVVNEVLKQLHSIYFNTVFDKKMEQIPEKHKEYTAYLEHKCKVQRRWTLFWYAVALVAIAHIIMGGR